MLTDDITSSFSFALFSLSRSLQSKRKRERKSVREREREGEERERESVEKIKWAVRKSAREDKKRENGDGSKERGSDRKRKEREEWERAHSMFPGWYSTTTHVTHMHMHTHTSSCHMPQPRAQSPSAQRGYSQAPSWNTGILGLENWAVSENVTSQMCRLCREILTYEHFLNNAELKTVRNDEQLKRK